MRTFGGFMIALVVENVGALTRRPYRPSVHYGFALEVFNMASVALLSQEDVVRLWIAADLPPYRHMKE